MKDKDLVNEIVESAIDKIWLPFEMKFIEWEAEYKTKYLFRHSWYEQKQKEWMEDLVITGSVIIDIDEFKKNVL